jgi:hypothetical protein
MRCGNGMLPLADLHNATGDAVFTARGLTKVYRMG